MPLAVKVIEATKPRHTSFVKRREEHIFVDTNLASKLGLNRLEYVIVDAGDNFFGIYTIEQLGNLPYETTVAIASPEGFSRLGGDSSTITTVTLRPFEMAASQAAAEASGGFFEDAVDDGSQTDMVVMAPHGGLIEPWTDVMAEAFRLAIVGEGHNCSRYSGYGYSDNESQSASDRWHVTAVDIHESVFTAVAPLVGRGFDYVLSFHGYAEEGYKIDVGGLADSTARSAVVSALTAALPGTFEINTATDDLIDGDSPDNIQNRVCSSAQHTIQLEMSYNARRDYRDDIVAALVTHYDTLLTP